MNIAKDDVIVVDDNGDIGFDRPVQQIPTNVLQEVIKEWTQSKLELLGEETYQNNPLDFKSYIDSINKVISDSQNVIDSRQINNYRNNFIS